MDDAASIHTMFSNDEDVDAICSDCCTSDDENTNTRDDAASIHTMFSNDEDEDAVRPDGRTREDPNTISRDDAASVHTMFSNDDDEDAIDSCCSSDDEETNSRDDNFFTMASYNQHAGTTSSAPLEYKNKRSGGLWDHFPPTPPPNRPLPPTPTPRAQEAPENSEDAVTAVWDEISRQMGRDPRAMSNLPNSAVAVGVDPKTGKLYPERMGIVLRALKTRPLSQAQKNGIFMKLRCQFRCPACKVSKAADGFPPGFQGYLDDTFSWNDLRCTSCYAAR